jgi:hypothetical protein
MRKSKAHNAISRKEVEWLLKLTFSPDESACLNQRKSIKGFDFKLYDPRGWINYLYQTKA